MLQGSSVPALRPLLAAEQILLLGGADVPDGCAIGANPGLVSMIHDA
jgi:hypothetical protein